MKHVYHMQVTMSLEDTSSEIKDIVTSINENLHSLGIEKGIGITIGVPFTIVIKTDKEFSIGEKFQVVDIAREVFKNYPKLPLHYESIKYIGVTD